MTVRFYVAHGASGSSASMRGHVEGLRKRGIDAVSIDLPVKKAEDVVGKRCYVAQADGEFWPPRARAFLSANFLDLGRLRAAGQWIKPDGSFTIAIPGEYVIVSRDGVVRPKAAFAAGTYRVNTSQRLAVVWAPAIERGLSPFRLQDRDF